MKYIATRAVDNIDGEVLAEGDTVDLDTKGERTHKAAIETGALVPASSPEAKKAKLNAEAATGNDGGGAGENTGNDGKGKGEPVKLATLKKSELIAYAKERDIAVDEKGTNAEIIDAIEKAEAK